MKSWQVSDEIQRDPALSELVDNSRATMEEIVGPFSQDLVDARWDLAAHGKTPTLWLTLSDWTCPEGKRITLSPTDLDSAADRARKFNRVWSDLLQAGSHKLLRELTRAVQEL